MFWGQPEPGRSDQGSKLRILPGWVPALFLILAIALIPWIIYLAISLPTRTVADHYRLGWVGFDVVLVVFLSWTAWLALHGKRQMELPAVVTATLLVVDAWFDIATSHSGWPQVEAVLLALFVEIPTAALALYISRRVERVLEAALDHAVKDHEMLGHSAVSASSPTTPQITKRDGPGESKSA